MIKKVHRFIGLEINIQDVVEGSESSDSLKRLSDQLQQYNIFFMSIKHPVSVPSPGESD